MSIEKKHFGEYEGKEVFAYTLTNKNGSAVTILNYGGILQSILMKDRDGGVRDLLVGFDNLPDYVACAASYFGALIGRYGNRISGGGFTLNGTRYELAGNETARGCHLHGGMVGFNRKVWDAAEKSGEGYDSLILTLFSPDGEEGYPGDLKVKVTYSFCDGDTLSICYEADTDRDTVLNMTNHAYFNLNGYDGGSVMEQYLQLNCSRYDAVDPVTLIPVGEPASVVGTDFDFLASRKITNSYDHNFIIDGRIGTLRTAAVAYDEASGIRMEVKTDMPAVQLYTAGGMDGAVPFKGGIPQRALHAFCLETQYSPDTPNRPYMPQCILKAGEHLRSVTEYSFGLLK